MINCYVIGERFIAEALCAHIKNYALTELKGYSFKFPENVNEFYLHRPDIVFVDTALMPFDEPTMNIIRGISTTIFVSKDAQMAFEAFEHLALDYLLTPISYNRFARSVNKYQHFRGMAHSIDLYHKPEVIESFFVKTDAKGFKDVLIQCNQLVYIHAMQNYVVLHMVDGKQYSCHNSMKEMEDSLCGSNFIRIHRSFIINEYKITAVEGNMVILNNNETQKLLIGNTYRKSFFDRKNLRMIRKQKPLTRILNFSRPASFVFGMGMIFYEFMLMATWEGGLL